MSRHIASEDIWVVAEPTKTCSVLSTIRKMQTKSILRPSPFILEELYLKPYTGGGMYVGRGGAAGCWECES